MSSYGEEYNLVWANLIINSYEKAAMQDAGRNLNRDAPMVQWLKSMSAMEMALDSSEKVLRGETPSPDHAQFATSRSALTSEESRSANSNPPGEPDHYKEWGTQNASDDEFWGNASWTGGGIRPTGSTDPETDACFKDNLYNAFDFDPETKFGGLGIYGPEASFEAHWDAAEAVDRGLRNLFPDKWGDPPWSKEDANGSYLEDCWSCLLNFDFNFQLPAANLTSEIDRLIKMLEDLLDWMLQRFEKSYDFLKDMLCDFSWLWSLLCLPDLIAFMAMLRGLLTKYMIDGLSLSLDWTGIVGPIIKAIVDALAMIIEQVVALIMVPIDCMISVIQTIDAFGKGLYETMDTATDFGTHIKNIFTDSSIGGLGSAGKPGNDGQGFNIEHGTGNSQKWPAGWGNAFDFSYDPKAQDAARAARNSGTRESTAMGSGTSWNLNLSNGLTKETEQGSFKKKGWNWASTSVAALAELKNWIKDIAQQIIFAVKSLSLLFSGQLKLSVMKSGLIMMIIDLIAFVTAIVKWIKAGGLDKFCDKDSAEELAEALNSTSSALKSSSGFRVVEDESEEFGTSVRIKAKRYSDGSEIDIPFTGCKFGHDSTSEKSKSILSVLDSLEQSTQIRREAWGI